ncbi:hypothetical protein LO80_08515 [Candidatus Francisella endociliophora]|uniref:Polysaccharide biosynthesis protein n=1 Tax=Candidatus Francisella endociliophora TaxID=653937 RepID=A0A097EQZ9_9GAMM|nr:oligosaccharide flippase family protein [Francisella sp. FSC1006]AIT10008.1 hypothetical protein LO80_08515 [Francisella sp. FSC1006]
MDIRNLKNGFYAVIDVVVSPLIMILLTPIFVHFLGVEQYGLWILVNSMVASLSLFNFGVSDVVIKYLPKLLTTNDYEQAKTLSSTIFIFQLTIAVVIILCFYIFTSLILPCFESSGRYSMYVSIFAVAIPLFLVKQFEQVAYSIFKSHERYGVVATLSLISKITFFSMQAFIAIETGSVYQVIKYSLIVAVIIYLIELLYIKMKYYYIHIFRGASFITFKSLLDFGIWNWFASILSILRVNSDKWIVSMLLGLKAFGYYSIAVLVFNQLYTVLASSIAWVFPKISSNSLCLNDQKKLFYSLMIFLVLAGSVLSLTLSASSNLLFVTWLGEGVYSNCKHFISLFLVMFPVFIMSAVSYYYILSLGLVRYKFIVDFLVLNIKIFVLWFSIRVGFLGEDWPLAFLIFLSVEIILYFRIVRKRIELKKSFIYYILIIQFIIIIVRLYLINIY